MSETNAFEVLQEFTRLHAVAKEMQKNAENLRRPADAYRALAAQVTPLLRRPAAALTRVADLLEETVRSMEDLRAIIAEDAACVRERLGKVNLSEADLEEIHARRAREAAEAERQKERPSVTIATSWLSGTSSSTSTT